MIIRRGDILQARYGENGSVPVVTLSEGIFNQKSGTVVVAALTNVKPAAGFPLSHPLSVKVNDKAVWAKPAQIKTLSTLQLGQVLGHVPEHDLQQIIAGLHEVIGG